MAAESEAMHTIEDDVNYERMKNTPKKNNVYSTHRKLSWQCDRDVKQFEKDRNLTTFELAREKTSMIERLAKLQEVQKQIQTRRHSEPNARRGRRSSEPAIALADLQKLENVDKSSTNSKEEPRSTGSSIPTRTLYARRNTVAEGIGDKASIPFLRRHTAPSPAASHGTKRKGSLEERGDCIREETT